MPSLKIQNKEIHYTESGSGFPVLLVHGFGEDSFIWRLQVPVLREKYRVIVPDLPGSGKSDPDNKDMLMEDYAAILSGLLKELKVQQATIIGHSMGGYITMAFVEQFPEMVCSYGLFHSSARADSEEKKETRRKGISFIKQHGAESFLKTMIPNLYSEMSRSANPGMVDEMIDRAGNFQVGALVSYYEAMMARPDRSSLLKKAGKPVLFILGEHDTAVPFNDGLEQTHLPEISYIHVLRDSGHMGMREETDKSNQALLEFLENTAC